jgi:hypothetical protein
VSGRGWGWGQDGDLSCVGGRGTAFLIAGTRSGLRPGFEPSLIVLGPPEMPRATTAPYAAAARTMTTLLCSPASLEDSVLGSMLACHHGALRHASGSLLLQPREAYDVPGFEPRFGDSGTPRASTAPYTKKSGRCCMAEEGPGFEPRQRRALLRSGRALRSRLRDPAKSLRPPHPPAGEGRWRAGGIPQPPRVSGSEDL